MHSRCKAVHMQTQGLGICEMRRLQHHKFDTVVGCCLLTSLEYGAVYAVPLLLSQARVQLLAIVHLAGGVPSPPATAGERSAARASRSCRGRGDRGARASCRRR